MRAELAHGKQEPPRALFRFGRVGKRQLAGVVGVVQNPGRRRAERGLGEARQPTRRLLDGESTGQVGKRDQQMQRRLLAAQRRHQCRFGLGEVAAPAHRFGPGEDRVELRRHRLVEQAFQQGGLALDLVRQEMGQRHHRHQKTGKRHVLFRQRLQARCAGLFGSGYQRRACLFDGSRICGMQRPCRFAEPKRAVFRHVSSTKSRVRSAVCSKKPRNRFNLPPFV
jgi:hypothetical protein